MSTNEPLILLVEDDDNDVFFMRRALQKAGFTNPLQLANNGQEAIDYLNGLGKFGDRRHFPMPSIIFLDLKMPFLDGFEVLGRIRSQPAIRKIPVVILTSSSEERDRQRAAALGAAGYFVKTPGVETVREMMQFLNEDIEEVLATNDDWSNDTQVQSAQ